MAANECKWCSFNHQTGINTFWVLSRDGIAMDPQHWSRVTVRGRPRNPFRRLAIWTQCTLALCWQQQSLWWFGSHPHTGSMCRESIWPFKRNALNISRSGFEKKNIKKNTTRQDMTRLFPCPWLCKWMSCLSNVTAPKKNTGFMGNDPN